MDHITIRVSDIKKSKSFYTSALKPLGYDIYKELNLEKVTIVGFSAIGKTKFLLTTDKPTTSFIHLAWKALSKKQVDDFYAQALRAGGKCNGGPGLREYKPSSYYAAYVFDPDGNNIEVVYGNN